MDAIRPYFAELMADQEWLPEMYQEPSADSGMGAGTGMWLLYRAGDGGLAFSSLVLHPGKVHSSARPPCVGCSLDSTVACRMKWSFNAETMAATMMSPILSLPSGTRSRGRLLRAHARE